MNLSSPPSARPFPPGFQFGAATAALQIEGATTVDGRGPSIWDTFCAEPGAIERGEGLEPACDHYRRYADDVAVMAELGLTAYRFSTAWSRICPDGRSVNRAGLDFYSRLVDELRGAGIEPFLTLYHWDLPQALQDRGGWADRDTAYRFADYAQATVRALGDRVAVWTTLNEPWCASFLSYTAGVHAPGRRSVTEGVLAAHHLLLAHGLAVQELRAHDPALRLGISLNLAPVEPARADSADSDAARRIDGQFNRWFLDPIFRGSYPEDAASDLGDVDEAAARALETATVAGDLDLIRSPIDFLGINYYHGEYVGAAPDPALRPAVVPATTWPTRSPFPAAESVHWQERGLPRTEMGWEVQPAGLTALLLRVQRDYTGTLPLYVTENGAAYRDLPQRDVAEVDGPGPGGGAVVQDCERADFLRAHLAALLDAVDAGVPVGGYFYWSLMDNFEWTWGYEKRFGIVYVDFATQQRTIKSSGREYARIIAGREI